MASATNQKSMELEGNLSSFQLADVLKFLAMGRMTGTLHLENHDRANILLFREGRLIGSASADRDVKLGQLLVNAGHLGRRQLQETLEHQRERRIGRRLGKLLLDRKLVALETLQQILGLQVKEELWEAFSWTSGSFRFEHGGSVEGEDELLSLEVEPLIDEGAQRLDQVRAIAGNPAHMDEVYVVNPKIAGPPETPLTPTAWRVLALINGRLSVRGLVFLSGLGKYETLSALDRLLSLGLIVPAGPTAATVAPRRSPEAHPDPDFLEPGAPVSEIAPADAGGGLRGLFGLRRRPSPANGKIVSEDSHAPAGDGHAIGPFPTGVGFACALLNHLAARVAAASAEDDAASPGAIWAVESCRFPRADLVRAVAGRLDASRFERYALMANGIDRFLAGANEESMEALAAVARQLARRGRQVLGGDGLQRSLAPFLAEVEIRWPAEFAPQTWIQQWMED